MVHIRPFGRHEIPVFRALLLRLTDFLSVFLPAIFPMFVPAWGATERILGCLAKGCLGKGSRVRYPLEPVWGLLGFFRAVWMTSGCDLRRLPSGGGFRASFLGIEQPWAAPSGCSGAIAEGPGPWPSHSVGEGPPSPSRLNFASAIAANWAGLVAIKPRLTAPVGGSPHRRSWSAPASSSGGPVRRPSGKPASESVPASLEPEPRSVPEQTGLPASRQSP